MSAEPRCGHCTHYSHGECWEAAMVMVREADSERVDAVAAREKAEAEVERLRDWLVKATEMFRAAGCEIEASIIEASTAIAPHEDVK